MARKKSIDANPARAKAILELAKQSVPQREIVEKLKDQFPEITRRVVEIAVKNLKEMGHQLRGKTEAVKSPAANKKKAATRKKQRDDKVAADKNRELYDPNFKAKKPRNKSKYYPE